jgi:hypothetical protein
MGDSRMIAACFAADFTGLPLYRLNIVDWADGYSATAAFDTALVLNKHWPCIFLLEDPFAGSDTWGYQKEALFITALSRFMDECRGVFIFLTDHEGSPGFRKSAIASRISARIDLPLGDSNPGQRRKIWESLLQTIALYGTGLDNKTNLARLDDLAIRELSWRQIQSIIRNSLVVNPDDTALPSIVVDWHLLEELANLEVICVK